jgi:pilus assembly protein CpaE
LNTILEKLRRLYDYIVVDTPSTLADLTLTVLDVADRIILITTPDIPAIKNAKLFFEVTEALEYPSGKTILVLNKADRHTNIRAEDIQASIKYPVASQIPLDERTAMAAANQGVPYMLIARSTPLAQATMTLGRHLISTTAEKVGADEESGEASGKAALSRTLG